MPAVEVTVGKPPGCTYGLLLVGLEVGQHDPQGEINHEGAEAVLMVALRRPAGRDPIVEVPVGARVRHHVHQDSKEQEAEQVRVRLADLLEDWGWLLVLPRGGTRRSAHDAKLQCGHFHLCVATFSVPWSTELVANAPLPSRNDNAPCPC